MSGLTSLNVWRFPLWIAHRGGGTLAPENTMAAFRTGLAHGYRAFECDVKLSADGIPYLFHDDRLDRCTSADGPAAAQPWSVLSRLDAGSWHSPRFAGEPLCSLDHLLFFAAANGVDINLELKPCPGREEETGRIVAHWLRDRWTLPADRFLISSFDRQALLAFGAHHPTMPKALLSEHYQREDLQWAQTHACVAIVAHWASWLGADIHAVRQSGLRALAYTVNSAAEADKLIRAGIQGLITDTLDQFPPAIQP